MGRLKTGVLALSIVLICLMSVSGCVSSPSTPPKVNDKTNIDDKTNIVDNALKVGDSYAYDNLKFTLENAREKTNTIRIGSQSYSYRVLVIEYSGENLPEDFYKKLTLTSSNDRYENTGYSSSKSSGMFGKFGAFQDMKCTVSYKLSDDPSNDPDSYTLLVDFGTGSNGHDAVTYTITV